MLFVVLLLVLICNDLSKKIEELEKCLKAIRAHLLNNGASSEWVNDIASLLLKKRVWGNFTPKIDASNITTNDMAWVHRYCLDQSMIRRSPHFLKYLQTPLPVPNNVDV